MAGIAKSMRLTRSRHGQRPIGHLLNVRADNMSAFSDRPDHFLDWIRDHCAHRLYLVADEAVALHPAFSVYRVEVAGGRHMR